MSSKTTSSGKKGSTLLNLIFGARGKNDDDSFRVMLIIMTLGLFALIIISIWAKPLGKGTGSAAVLGLSIIVSLSALVIGGFLGFLFGIPRSLQRVNEGAVTTTGNSNGNNGERYYSNNTNLEQISDWLTKIIVGVSLT